MAKSVHSQLAIDIWFIAVGIVSSMDAVGTAKDIKYFTNYVKKSVTILTIFQFVVNLYSFSLMWEIIQVFIIIVISWFVKPEYQDKNGKTAIKFLNTILAIMGFYMLYHSIKMTMDHLDDIVISELIKAMV
jgi:hypothetical protein